MANKKTRTKQISIISNSQLQRVGKKSLRFGSPLVMMGTFLVVLASIGAGVFIFQHSRQSEAYSMFFTGDFETGNLKQWGTCQSIAYNDPCINYPHNHYSMQAVTSPVRQGSYASRFEVRDGDYPFCCGERAQIRRGVVEKEGLKFHYTWSFMLDRNFPLSSSDFQLLLEWHSTVNGSPPLAFFVNNGNLVLRAHPNPNNFSGVNLPVNLWTKPIQTGVWYDLSFEATWSQSGQIGNVRYLKLNGSDQTFTANPQHGNGQPCIGKTECFLRTIHLNDPGNYVIMGYYRSPNVSGTGIVYHDNFSASQLRDLSDPPPKTLFSPTPSPMPTSPSGTQLPANTWSSWNYSEAVSGSTVTTPMTRSNTSRLLSQLDANKPGYKAGQTGQWCLNRSSTLAPKSITFTASYNSNNGNTLFFGNGSTYQWSKTTTSGATSTSTQTVALSSTQTKYCFGNKAMATAFSSNRFLNVTSYRFNY